MRRDQASPISFLVNVGRLPQKGLPVELDATPEQRTELAETHALLDVAAFRAEIMVVAWRRNGVRVSGRVTAAVTQECVVTLEPLPAKVDEAFSQVFLPDDSKLGRQGFNIGGEMVLDPDGPDAPETFSGDTIDVGALAEEFFGLSLDPYPRKQGGSLPASAPEADQPESSPLREKLLPFARKS